MTGVLYRGIDPGFPFVPGHLVVRLWRIRLAVVLGVEGESSHCVGVPSGRLAPSVDVDLVVSLYVGESLELEVFLFLKRPDDGEFFICVQDVPDLHLGGEVSWLAEEETRLVHERDDVGPPC